MQHQSATLSFCSFIHCILVSSNLMKIHPHTVNSQIVAFVCLNSRNNQAFIPNFPCIYTSTFIYKLSSCFSSSLGFDGLKASSTQTTYMINTYTLFILWESSKVSQWLINAQCLERLCPVRTANVRQRAGSVTEIFQRSTRPIDYMITLISCKLDVLVPLKFLFLLDI